MTPLSTRVAEIRAFTAPHLERPNRARLAGYCEVAARWEFARTDELIDPSPANVHLSEVLANGVRQLAAELDIEPTGGHDLSDFEPVSPRAVQGVTDNHGCLFMDPQRLMLGHTHRVRWTE